MRIQILYFGGLTPLVAGVRREELILDAPCDTEGVLDRLCDVHPDLGRARRYVRVAINERFSDADQLVHDGDRVALIPPVAGGDHALVRVTPEPLDVQAVIDAVAGPSQGAIAVFIGTVRDHNDGKQVIRLEYETYAEMVVPQIVEIVGACEASGEGVRIAVAHRVGVLQVGDAAVAIAASAPHRPEAFAACRECIEQLKRSVPIWKREFSPEGEEWIGLGA
jgi:molybdopterin synthase catalytic subunit/molybdopterin converting factor small subunit